MTGSNRRPPACKAGALPAELIPPFAHTHKPQGRTARTCAAPRAAHVVGLVGLEPTTPALSRRCSDQLSYRPAPKTKPLAAIPACGVTRASLKSRSAAHAPLGFAHQPTTDKQPISVGKHHLLTPDAPFQGAAGARAHGSFFQKGGDPAAPSGTATLLRLHPSHEPRRGKRPPNG